MLGTGLLGIVLAHVGLMQILGGALSMCGDVCEACCGGICGMIYSLVYTFAGTCAAAWNIPLTLLNGCMELFLGMIPFI